MIQQTNKIIILTKPISVNRLYCGRRFLTKEGKAIKEAMAWEVKNQWKHKILDKAIGIEIYFFVPNKKSDLDNLLKGLLDILTGIIYKDDSQIYAIHCYKVIDKQRPRIEIEVMLLK